MRSTNGTDTSKLIKALAMCGVKNYDDGVLRVEFFERKREVPLTPMPISDKIEEKSSSTSIPAQAHAVEDDTRKVADQLRRKEQMISELLLTDPLKYEEMLENGELTRIDSTETDGDGEEDAEETHA